MLQKIRREGALEAYRELLTGGHYVSADTLRQGLKAGRIKLRQDAIGQQIEKALLAHGVPVELEPCGQAATVRIGG